MRRPSPTPELKAHQLNTTKLQSELNLSMTKLQTQVNLERLQAARLQAELKLTQLKAALTLQITRLQSELQASQRQTQVLADKALAGREGSLLPLASWGAWTALMILVFSTR